MLATATTSNSFASAAVSHRVPGIVPHGYDFYCDPGLFPQAKVAAPAIAAPTALVPSCSLPMPVAAVDAVPRTIRTIRNPASIDRRIAEIRTENFRRSRAA